MHKQAQHIGIKYIVSKYGSGIIGKSIFERKTMNRMVEGKLYTSVKEHCV